MVRFESSAAFVAGLVATFGHPTWGAKASNTDGELLTLLFSMS